MDKKEIDKQDNTDSDNGWDWAFVIILLAILPKIKSLENE